ncbi:hypothetical protein WME90_09930 [Sorangium sp. So ce375]|uniref:hypothetical protein n=1 Tax=Sorangium sp. So ce375 TaxID=3133306 RepID=UPI003F5B45CF
MTETVPEDESKRRDEADALERAEFERAGEEFERSRQVKPSRLIDPPDAELVMSPIIFNDYPLIWLGEEHTVFVYFLAGGRRTHEPLDVTWASLDPNVIAIRETERLGQSFGARLVGAAVGITKIVATTAAGHREELEIRVVDRSQIEIQWF